MKDLVLIAGAGEEILAQYNHLLPPIWGIALGCILRAVINLGTGGKVVS